MLLVTVLGSLRVAVVILPFQYMIFKDSYNSAILYQQQKSPKLTTKLQTTKTHIYSGHVLHIANQWSAKDSLQKRLKLCVRLDKWHDRNLNSRHSHFNVRSWWVHLLPVNDWPLLLAKLEVICIQSQLEKFGENQPHFLIDKLAREDDKQRVDDKARWWQHQTGEREKDSDRTH